MRGWFEKGMPGGRVRLKHDVWFVRHGQTDWNAERRYQGHADIPLNDTGRAQAARNGRALTGAVPDPHLTLFATSPLQRASETLEIIRNEMNLPVRRYALDDRLIEIDLGEWNGRTYDEIAEMDPELLEQRNKRKWDFVVPGGESYADAAGRVREFLTALDRPAVISGHGATGRILRGYLRGLNPGRVASLNSPQDVIFHIRGGREIEL